MKVGIFIAYCYCLILSIFFKIISLFVKKKDLVIYLHSPKYSDGYFRRFLLFHDEFRKNEIDYEIFDLIDENDFQKVMHRDLFHFKYKLYLKLSFKRAHQVSKACFYRNILVQRILFPFYPEYTSLFFEKVLKKMGGNRILDIWDPIHIWHPKLTYSSFNYYNKLSVNTELLKKDYSLYFPLSKIYIWPIAVQTNKHENIGSKSNKLFRLFYTGSKGNTKSYLEPLIPILEEMLNEFNIELHTVGSYAPLSNKLKIVHEFWSEENINNAIKNSDFGLYPNFQKDKNKNYTVAGKVLDYMSAKLPIIGANQGLPEGIDADRAIFIADSLDDWTDILKFALNSKSEAIKKSEYAFNFVEENLNVSKVFNVLKEDLLEV